MDGNIAPLSDLAELCKKYDAMFVVDDAHGVGVLGASGKGSTEHLHTRVDLIIGTLSKAIPSVGGYVSGNKSLINYIRNKARSFIYTTAPSPSSLAASIQAIELVQLEGHRRRILHEKTNYFVNLLNNSHLNILNHGTPIVSIVIGDERKVLKLQHALLTEGIFIPAIRPPTVKIGSSRLRASVNYDHSKATLKKIATLIIQYSKDI